ncbi:A-kinase anchor protein 10, mitochondrial isoform X1 [Mobula birostris]|uniref:A-kinase anchor protein 10, mitochondrial isoform X1 n=1 Tax=Mobula birostris TaxID=1983395 RepID=UPI003B2870F5
MSRGITVTSPPAFSFVSYVVMEVHSQVILEILKLGIVPASVSVATPSPSRNHALLEAAGPSNVAINAISANMDSFARGRTAVLKQQPIHMEAAHFGDLGHSSLNYRTEETNSRLSKTLEQVLQDSVALPYIIQYMEMQGVGHILKFWLEAESFRSTSWSRIRAHSLNIVKHSSLAEPPSPSSRRHNVDGPVLLDSSTSPDLEAKGDLVSQSEKLCITNPISLDCVDRTKASPDHSFNQGGSDLNLSHVGTSQTITIQTEDASEESIKSTSMVHPHSTELKGLSDRLMKSIERDAVKIFTKYISPDASRPIPIVEAVRNDIVAKICGEDGQVDPNCFVSAQAVMYIIMEKEHFTEFLRSHHFCKYQIEVLTSGTVYLADILFNESALFYFSEYMEKEEAINILQFWLAADNFQAHLAAKNGQYDGQEAQNDAMILYDKYFSLQATHPLGFDDSVRLEIESNICREGGPLPNCFTTPLRQAWTTMEKVYLPGFLSSNLYYKYLNDLIHSVRSNDIAKAFTSFPGQGPNSPHEHESNTGTPDSSTPQHGVRKTAIKILKNFDEAIVVDAASLEPESLYHRTFAGRMTFGKINELGQFIRESEPEPDVKKSKGSMFSQAMKKWVQGNTDEAQEEMAWKIAKMIVNDVIQQAQSEPHIVKSTKWTRM